MGRCEDGCAEPFERREQQLRDRIEELEDVVRDAMGFASDMMQQLGWARGQSDELATELEPQERQAYAMFGACWKALPFASDTRPRQHGLQPPVLERDCKAESPATMRDSGDAVTVSEERFAPPLANEPPCPRCDRRDAGLPEDWQPLSVREGRFAP